MTLSIYKHKNNTQLLNLFSLTLSKDLSYKIKVKLRSIIKELKTRDLTSIQQEKFINFLNKLKYFFKITILFANNILFIFSSTIPFL